MIHLNRKIRDFKGLTSESGQGALEYILIMVVMVSIIVGLLLQFNKAFETYANNLFGEYLECLLETGELPALSAEDADSSTCSQFFASFQGADIEGIGGDPNGGPTGGGSGNNGGSNGSSNNNSSNGGSNGSSNRSRQSKLSEGAPGNSRGSSGTSGRFGRLAGYQPARRGNRGAGAGGGGGQDDAIDTGSTGFSSMNYGSNRSGAPKVFKEEGNLKGGFGISQADEEDREAPIPVKVTKEELQKKKKEEVFTEERKPAAKGEIEVDDSGFGVGGFLRWLIIAAIIVALVLFFGGQALQISKSMD